MNTETKLIYEAYQTIYESWWDDVEQEGPEKDVKADAEKIIASENEEEISAIAQKAAHEIPPEQTEETADKEWEISARFMPYLQEKINKLNRKSAKLGTPPITLTKTGEEIRKITSEVNGEELLVQIIKIKLQGSAPVLDGWQFVATIEHIPGGNMIYKVPGLDLKTPLTTIFKNQPPTCDWCKINRSRLETFLIRKLVNGVPVEGKCVGRTCLKDFLGGNDPQKYLAYAKSLTDIIGMLAEFEAAGAESPHPRAAHADQYVEAFGFLCRVATNIRNFGWISAAKAREQGRSSTTSDALIDISNAQKGNQPKKSIEQEDKELAQKTIDWAQNDLPKKIEEITNKIAAGTASSFEQQSVDYLNNLHTALQSNYLTWKQARIAGSAIIAYKKETEWKDKQKEQASKSNEWVGQLGGKISKLHVTLKGKNTFQTDYGMSTLVRFEDDVGNKLAWFATNTDSLGDWDIGTSMNIDGTVKAHQFYPRGSQNKQTLLTRVKNSDFIKPRKARQPKFVVPPVPPKTTGLDASPGW